MIYITNPLSDSTWDKMCGATKDCSFFHSSNWARVLNESYSYKPLYFVSSGGNDQQAGMVPIMEVDSFLSGKRGVSLPFTDYCEPISPDENCFSEIFYELIQYGRKAGWKYVELRGGARFLNGTLPYCSYLRHVLRINESEAGLLQKASAATRRNIKTAKNWKVRVSISDLESDLREYYRLHCLTRKRHGLPPQPWSFFRAIFTNAIAMGNGFTVLARHSGMVVAGAVYLHSGKNGIYKFGASDMKFQFLRANNLVMWEAIRWFSRNGFEEMSFGRTEPGNMGLMRFKNGWGAEEEKIAYYRYDFERSTFVEGGQEIDGIARRGFRALPGPVLRIMGEVLYRHMG